MSVMLFSQRSVVVGYWWIPLCNITYESKDGEREQIEMRRMYRCYNLIPWTIFNQSSWLETLVVKDTAHKIFFCSISWAQYSEYMSVDFILQKSDKSDSPKMSAIRLLNWIYTGYIASKCNVCCCCNVRVQCNSKMWNIHTSALIKCQDSQMVLLSLTIRLDI